MNKLPQYSTILFNDVWEDVESFIDDYRTIGIPTTISFSGDGNSATTLFYLLYARYGNNPIANKDVKQWKHKIFSTIFQYGPAWEKRLDIQKKVRELSDTEILIGSKAIHNQALNPSTEPSTKDLEELEFINSQDTTNYKKSKLEAYAQLNDLIKTDVTEEFLVKFKKCFKLFVSAERPLLFVTDEED